MPLTKEQQEKIKRGYRLKYGELWPPLNDTRGRPTTIPRPDFQIEKECYLEGPAKVAGHLGAKEHFKRFVTAIWGSPADPDGYFEWNPNADKMLEAALKHKFVSVAGGASTGKSSFGGMYAVALYLIDPEATKILVTSMTIASAEGKIWGYVVKYWKRAARLFSVIDPKTGNIVQDGEFFMKGKLVPSKHIIKRRGEDGTLYATEGIELVPAEAGEFKKSAKKIQGYKGRGKVIVIGDEFATLAPNILETAKENLFANTGFQIIAFFNPESHYDPGGLISTPRAGWDSITPDTEEWETVIDGEYYGWCLRFDGMKSPNVLAGREIYRGLLTLEGLNGYLAMYQDQNTAGFWKMVRGYWSPTGLQDAIYTEIEVENSGALRRIKVWDSLPVMIASIDPAYVSGGDRAVGTFFKVGRAVCPEFGDIRTVLEKVEHRTYDEDMANKEDDKPTQVAKKFAADCKRLGVKTEDVALDVTGGHAFGSLLAIQMGRGFMALNFSGSPSEGRVSKVDKRLCRDAFRDLMSEIWYSAKPLLRSGQIRGLDPDTVREMCSRTYKDSGGRMEIEPKEKMKARIKKSPDKADSFLIGVLLARRRHGLMGMEKFAGKPKTPPPNDPTKGMFDWGKKKKPRLNEPEYVQPGGGWGDDDMTGFGGMFGR